jgi:hypothetical protein
MPVVWRLCADSAVHDGKGKGTRDYHYHSHRIAIAVATVAHVFETTQATGHSGSGKRRPESVVLVTGHWSRQTVARAPRKNNPLITVLLLCCDCCCYCTRPLLHRLHRLKHAG